ncbi:zinc ribbon domain-containing protein, partial [Burkholderia sp. Cy-647]|nr:zinc ribbon domain-containing protein [Burkholderia sp. Cy-647]
GSTIGAAGGGGAASAGALKRPAGRPWMISH